MNLRECSIDAVMKTSIGSLARNDSVRLIKTRMRSETKVNTRPDNTIATQEEAAKSKQTNGSGAEKMAANGKKPEMLRGRGREEAN
jgi:hypothetical protein